MNLKHLTILAGFVSGCASQYSTVPGVQPAMSPSAAAGECAREAIHAVPTPGEAYVFGLASALVVASETAEPRARIARECMARLGYVKIEEARQ